MNEGRRDGHGSGSTEVVCGRNGRTRFMKPNRSIPDCVVIPELAYADVGEAVAWLCDAFGFRERLRIANHRAQLTIGANGAVVVTERSGAPQGDQLHSIMVRVED